MAQDPIDELMVRLRREYLAEMPGRLLELSHAIAAWGGGKTPATSLLTLFHRLSGSAGAYGFSEVSRICRETEQWLANDPDPLPENAARLRNALGRIEQAFRTGPEELDIAGA
jgi:HPt (histidine-containing phosphotransfer) domain-containing protein